MEATTQPTNTDAPVLVGQLCTVPGCHKPATQSYLWEWGEKGMCCDEHRFLLNQTSGTIARSIQFGLFNPGQSPPVERPERVALITRAVAAEAETEELRGRSLDMYRQNRELASQVQMLTVRDRDAQAQLAFAKEQKSELEKKLGARDAEHGALYDEVVRLRMLIPPPEGPSVIEGGAFEPLTAAQVQGVIDKTSGPPAPTKKK